MNFFWKSKKDNTDWEREFDLLMARYRGLEIGFEALSEINGKMLTIIENGNKIYFKEIQKL